MPLRVLLTGANGYIAQHIIAAFVEAGHSVRGVVRSEQKIAQLEKVFHKYAGTPQLDFGVVPDISVPGAFDKVLRSDPPFDIVIHTASPYNFRDNTSNAAFLDPAIKGTTSILNSIATHAPSVRRVVLTSSMAAILNFSSPPVSSPPKVYTEEDWNPIQWDDALATDNMFLVYLASKKFSEKAAWDFVLGEGKGGGVAAGTKPNFDLVVLDPPVVLGPLADESQAASTRPENLTESFFLIYNALLRPDQTAESTPGDLPLHLYVDVRDLAQANLLAATTPAAGGKRFVVCAEQGHMSAQRVADILREALPDLRDKIPKGTPGQPLPEGIFSASSQLARDVLGIRFRTPEETINDMASQLRQVLKQAAA